MRKLKGRSMYTITEEVIEQFVPQFAKAGDPDPESYRLASAAMEAAFQADPDNFGATYGLTRNEVGRLRRWLAKDPCHNHRPPQCFYYRLCARCRKEESERIAYCDEVDRLTSGLQHSWYAHDALHGGILSDEVTVLAHRDDNLTSYRSVVTGKRAFIKVADGGDTTYVNLLADAETTAAAEQLHSERIRAERNRPIDPATYLIRA